MSWRIFAVTLVTLIAALGLLVHFFGRELSRSWLALGIHPAVLSHLELELEDQKLLARLDSPHGPEYRARFARTQELLGRLRILDLSRAEMFRRYELMLLALVVGILLVSAAFQVIVQRRQGFRLGLLRSALEDLSAGQVDLKVPVRGSDIVARTARMIEDTSHTLARARRRLAVLEHLSCWQEAARRQAHELRTPLTAARLELSRLSRVSGQRGASPADVAAVVGSIEQEMDRLEVFAEAFTAPASIPEPQLQTLDFRDVLADFAGLFERAWANVQIFFVNGTEELLVEVDREMIRQVLVNLCDNASSALSPANGALWLRPQIAGGLVVVDVVDDGPGVSDRVRARLFEPYATTRAHEGGMGLGLPIARKILLDHGGDLELASTSSAGTTFRLTLPRLTRGG